MMQEDIVIVDENDQVIGTAEKLLVHQQAMLHRAFSVFVFRKQLNRLELLLQQRQLDKYHSAGFWTNTCCGHPHLNEDIIWAGQRRLKEEMGIDVQLKEMGTFHYQVRFDNHLTENEIDHVLIGFFKEQPIEVDPNEVVDFCWIDVQTLQKDLQIRSEKYTKWLPQALALSLRQGSYEKL